MMMYVRWSCVLAIVTGLAVSTVNAVSKINVKGAKFFTEDGNQFYIKGVAYQLTPDDPLVNTDQCKLDASLMKDLGANSVRVYHVDPLGDHKGCMDAFANNGIYVFVDLDTFTTQIEPNDLHWNKTQLDAFTKVLDEFVKYDNTAGVFVGNEVLTKAEDSDAAPYVKAAARDVKAYRDSKNMRKVPVGYSAADISSLRPMLQNYLACGTNSSESLDFFSLNAYEWCGNSAYTTSGYDQLQKNATAYSIPIFLSETGCNSHPPRDFADQAAVFGPNMAGTWSGAIVYEWLAEANNYGLVNYGAKLDEVAASAAAATATDAPMDGYPRKGTPTPVSPDFRNLKMQWATLSPSGIKESAYSPTNTPPACPASISKVWDVNGNVALPTLGQTQAKAQSGSGSASATTTSTASATASSPTKKGSASGGKEVASMSAALTIVLFGFVCWL